MSRMVVAALLCFSLMNVILGCSDGKSAALSAIRDLNESKIQKLTTCYGMFYAFKNSKGPESEEQFKSFISDDENIDLQLERIGLKREDFDACFTGDDGEPLIVFYSVPAPAGPGLHKPIVFQAANGSFHVGFSDGSTTEVDQDEYNEFLVEAKRSRR